MRLARSEGFEPPSRVIRRGRTERTNLGAWSELRRTAPPVHVLLRHVYLARNVLHTPNVTLDRPLPRG